MEAKRFGERGMGWRKVHGRAERNLKGGGLEAQSLARTELARIKRSRVRRGQGMEGS